MARKPEAAGMGGGSMVLARQRSIPERAARSLLTFARRKPLGAAGGVLVLLLVFVAIFASVIAPYAPKAIIGPVYTDPDFAAGWNHWGTDHLGRDVFSRIVWGARLSLYVGLVATLIGTTTGMLWGVAQGYWGGTWFDTISQRIAEAQISIPSLILALTFIAVLGPSINNVILAIALNYIPSQARIIRSVTLSIRERAFIDAAKAVGAPTWRIILMHVVPNIFSIYLIYLSLHLGGAIITESSLSFLGLGVPPDEPSWGGMITRGTQQALLGGVPWLALFPGLCIAGVVYGFNLLGDGLRDILDPRLRGQGAR